MNVRNEPLHDMACVVKRYPPRYAEGNFVSLYKKDISFENKSDWVEGVMLTESHKKSPANHIA